MLEPERGRTSLSASRWKILSVLGQGNFGKVLEVAQEPEGKAEDAKDAKVMALKVIRDVKKYKDDAVEDANILKTLHRASSSGSHDPARDGRYCARLEDMFTIKHRGRKHMCLMFEKCGKSLYEFMKANGRLGFSIGDVEDMAYVPPLEFPNRT